MPFIEGETLRQRITREKCLPVDDALRLTREIADALACAHAHDVIHRDIKPENILLQSGHAVVADFGIARAVKAAGSERMTATGLAIGTPAYMSPEQAAGERDVDGRSDLYALASVLYEMLAGEAPFTGATPDVILLQRFTQPPPKITTKRPGIPRAIEAAICTAMARAPEDRFPTVERFVASLEAKAGAPDADLDRSIAVLPFANMSGDPENEYFSDGVSEEIINALAQLPRLRVAARTSAFSFKGKNVDLRSIGDQLNVATVLEGSVRKAGGRIRITAQLSNVADGYQLWSERYDRELTDIFAIQDEIATAIAEKLKATLGVSGEGRLVRPPTGTGSVRPVPQRPRSHEAAGPGLAGGSRGPRAGRGTGPAIGARPGGAGGSIDPGECLWSGRTRRYPPPGHGGDGASTGTWPRFGGCPDRQCPAFPHGRVRPGEGFGCLRPGGGAGSAGCGCPDAASEFRPLLCSRRVRRRPGGASRAHRLRSAEWHRARSAGFRSRIRRKVGGGGNRGTPWYRDRFRCVLPAVVPAARVGVGAKAGKGVEAGRPLLAALAAIPGC